MVSTPPPGPADAGRARMSVQVRHVLDSVPDVGVEPPDWESTGQVDHLHRRDVVLVRDADAARVQARLGGRFADEEDDDPSAGARGRAARARRLPGFRRLRQTRGVADALDIADRSFGRGVATPDHVLWVTPRDFCPAHEPEVPVAGVVGPLPARAPARQGVGGQQGTGGQQATRAQPTPGTGVRVSVVDTGWWSPAAEQHAWLAGVTGDEEDVYDAEGRIRSYAGHGTFAAGVVRSVAPACTLRVEGVVHTAGAWFESDVVRQLDEALAWTPDIISLQAGATTRGNLPLLAFEVFAQRLRAHKGTVLLAAAGNDASVRPYWPAASPWAVAVGALTADGSAAADYTNAGPWVDVSAVGDDHVNAFPTGTYLTTEPKSPAGQLREFTGLARWSGTSFAAPLVAGMVAARMTRTGVKAPRALHDLLEQAMADAIPGVGPAARL